MLKKLFAPLHLTSIQLILITVGFWMVFANAALFAALLRDYPLNLKNAVFLATAVFGFSAVQIIVLSLVCFRWTIKPILIVLLIASSQAAYYMDTYNVIIDDLMITNVLETDTKEAGDLISVNMLLYLFFLGLLPSLVVYRARIVFKPLGREIVGRVALVGGLLAVALVLYFLQSAVISSFFREHKPIRFYANPSSYVFALGRQVRNYRRSLVNQQPLILTGEDAKIPDTDITRELIIMVVGETARADRFSLNGYERKTNPLLEKQAVASFRNVTSCATLTALSVPCMFSMLGEKGFSVSKARGRENALDVLVRSGAHVLWRDNNSSSKGVSERIVTEDYRNPKINTICDEECRDVGMLVGLSDYIAKHPTGDIVIVLHAMGNHGPAYYKRYPKAFRKFTPECRTNELADCSVEEINNAYDNAILYTDYFLNEVIAFLKKHDAQFETAMLYVSDHGESLGENNIYLHGLPNFLAPKEQRHVPMIMWVGENYRRVNIDALRAKKEKPYSHDHIFHTLLGMLEIESKSYNKFLDITKN